MFEATTRREFLETLVFGAGIASGLGLVGLLNGCELGQQKPTWEEAKVDYREAITRSSRIHKGTFADRMRWLTENREYDSEIRRKDILWLWTLAETGNDPATTYTEIVLPGIRDHGDYYFRKAMETESNSDRYNLANEQFERLSSLFLFLEHQIREKRFALPPEPLRERDFVPVVPGSLTFQGPVMMGVLRDTDRYYEKERRALSDAEMRFRNADSRTLDRDAYLTLMTPLTSNPDLVIKTTYQTAR